MRKTDLKYYFNFFFPVLVIAAFFLLGTGSVSFKKYGIPLSFGGSLNRLFFFSLFISVFLEKENRSILAGKAENLAYIFIFWAIFASFFHKLADDAISYLLNLLVFPVSFILGLRMAVYKKYLPALLFMIVAGAVVSVLRDTCQESGLFMVQGINRLTGVQGHPNFSGFYYAVVFILAFNMMIAKKFAFFWKLIVFPAAFIILWGLMNTYSRSSVTGVVIALLLLIVVFLMNPEKTSLNWLVFFIFVLIALIFSGRIINGSFSDRINNVFAGEMDESSRERIYCWSSSLEIIKDNPVTGVGTGNMRFRQNYILKRNPSAKYLLPHPHNLLLSLCTSIGVPGLIFFLAMILISLLQILKNNFIGNSLTWVLSVTSFGFVICLITAGIFDSFFMSGRLSALSGLMLSFAYYSDEGF